MSLFHQLRLRPRLLSAIGAGLALVLLWPTPLPTITRLLLGWTSGVWLYLLLVFLLMHRADAHHLKQRALAQADGVVAVLLLAVVGALASLAAIALELSQFRHGVSVVDGWPYLLLAIATVSGSWLLLPAEFALAYASLYHRGAAPHGLEFPGNDKMPDFSDFLYFSVTLAATSQTSDVAVSARPMRRLVLVQAVLSFVFNTGVLALTINILASLIS